MREFAELGIDLRGKTAGQVKTLCPKCSHLRKKKKEPCLSVNIDEGTYTCWNSDCQWQGGVKGVSKTKDYAIPSYNDSPLGEKATEYMRSRGITASTIKKHRMTEEEEYIPKNQKKVPCIVWNYFRDGNLVNKKYRSGNKGFKMSSGAELIFYNLDAITDCKEVIITEGEFDCMAYDEAGLGNVISVPNGANTNTNNMQYLDNCADKFEKATKIYLAMDADEAGDSLLQELSRRLGRDRCFKVKYPAECKDANQTLVEHGADALKMSISNAEAFPIEGVITANDVKEDILRLYRNGMERGEELVPMGAEFCNICTFKTSLLYVITGIPSHGKSTILNHWEVILAAQHGWKFAIFSPEHYPLEYFIYKYAELIVGMPFFDGRNPKMNEMTLLRAIEFVNEHFFFIRPEGESFTLDKILKSCSSLVMRHGIKGFTIDPWNMIDHDFSSMTETQYIERSINKLTVFKQKHDIAIFLVAHPTKMQKSNGVYEVPSLYDIAGSSNFYNKCDFGITVYRNFVTNETEVYIQKCKYKNLGKIDYTKMTYNVVNNRFTPIGHEHDRRSLLPAPEQIDMGLEEELGEFNEIDITPPF